MWLLPIPVRNKINNICVLQTVHPTTNPNSVNPAKSLTAEKFQHCFVLKTDETTSFTNYNFIVYDGLQRTLLVIHM